MDILCDRWVFFVWRSDDAEEMMVIRNILSSTKNFRMTNATGSRNQIFQPSRTKSKGSRISILAFEDASILGMRETAKNFYNLTIVLNFSQVI